MTTTAPTTTTPLEPKVGCIAAAMEIVGNKWTALILRDLTTGPKRFNQLEKSLSSDSRGVHDGRTAGISPRTLGQRLDDLEAHGIVTKQTFAEVPPRCEYALTPKGHDLMPILKQMAVWGEKYYDASC